MPLFVIDSTVCPLVSIESTKGELYSTIDPDSNGIAENIPIPQGVWPDPEEDGHMILVDPKINKAWEFSRPDSFLTAVGLPVLSMSGI